jgi:long-subunit acyl-CoA synthetase (AMP-forming)
MSFNLATILTETASSCSFNRPGDRRMLSIGKPMWGVTMRVGDAFDQPLPPGREHVGEILIRGRFMAELPKGPSGKILKSALRDG